MRRLRGADLRLVSVLLVLRASASALPPSAPMLFQYRLRTGAEGGWTISRDVIRVARAGRL